jgi:hypothetical protein
MNKLELSSAVRRPIWAVSRAAQWGDVVFRVGPLSVVRHRWILLNDEEPATDYAQPTTDYLT